MINDSPARRNINRDLGISGAIPYPTESDLDLLRSALQGCLLQYFQKIITLTDGMKILFVGGGIGREIYQLKKKNNFYALNVDINLPLLKRGKQYRSEKNFQCDYLAGCGLKLPFKDNTFDSVIFYESLHHMDDIFSCLEEACRVGNKVIIFDRRRCLVSKLGAALHLIKPDFDGLYANEMDMARLTEWIKRHPEIYISYRSYHLYYLLAINRQIHRIISRHKLITVIDIACVKFINRILGFMGNGAVIAIERRWPAALDKS